MLEKAISSYQRALSLNPSDPDLCNDLGIILMQMERYSEAQFYLKKASELKPENYDIRYSLASVYRDGGKLDEAISEYKKVIQDMPDYPNIHNDLGDIYRQKGQSEESLKEFNAEIEHSQVRLLAKPDDPFLLNNLAYALNGSGQPDRAMEIIEKVIAAEPNYRQPYITLAKIYERKGDFDAATEALHKARAVSNVSNFIDRDIERFKKQLQTFGDDTYAIDTIYLKNGRQIHGRIKEEDSEKIILDVGFGGSTGTLTFYRNAIDRVAKSKGK
jgi:tetratricopeptide (TPR) repeat protein